MNIIGKTMVGSHIWKMNNEDSDEDYFEIYLDTTENLFRGTPHNKSKFTQVDGVDTHSHELGHVIEQLLKGNINFVIGVTSPITVISNEHFEELKKITYRNISKNIYHSIHGMARHNYKRFIASGEDTNWQRYSKILRGIEFGIRVLKFRKVEYKPPKKVYKTYNHKNEELYHNLIADLEIAFEESTIPEKPNEDEFRDFLCDIRKLDWWENLKV